METTQTKPMWWCSTSVRISHPDLDPIKVSEMLNSTAQIALRPGESKVPHGACRSAGYWCMEHRIDAPDPPNVSLSWAEEFIRSRETHFHQLLDSGCDIDIYIGVFSNVLALGFNLPPMPTTRNLGISVGIEFFSK